MDSYHAGVTLGIFVGIAAGLFVLALLFKKKVLDMHFDERQELARGKAFQYGFFTLIITAYAYGASDMIFGRWCDALVGVTICLAVSMCVFAVTCILKDAYLSLREKPRTVMTMLTFRAVNPIIGVLVLVILVVYIVNHLLCSREEEAE